ncbi:MAG: hypothetical protein AAF713_00195 [Pseudomonadota bacterium]
MCDRLFDILGCEFAERERWELFPMADAVVDRVEALGERWVTWAGDGVILTFERHLLRFDLTGIQIQVAETDDLLPYSGALPMGLHPAMTEEMVEAVLGEPHRSGGHDDLGALGYLPPWLAYGIRPGVQARISFGGNSLDDAGIDRITLGRPTGLHS